MKILHTIADLTMESGGTTTATYALLETLNKCGFEVDVLTSENKSSNNKTIGKGEKWIHILANDNITPFRYSKNIKNFLKEDNIYDIYHTNGLWTYCNHATCKIAKEKGIPYVITLHGMLYPQALRQSSLKKKIALSLFFKNDLNYASCIHCTCEEEMNYCRLLGLKNPIAIIPNIINIPVFSNIINIEHKKRIGYLGRLHPRKKVENIIYAWSRIRPKDAELLIMGSGDLNYESFLKNEVLRLNLKNVTFTGFVSGRDKFNKLASLSALCVPSNYENFGMIIPEALSVGTPVIASTGTPWKILNDKKCGWWVNNKPEILAEVFLQLFELKNEEIKKMGERGKEMIEHKFNPTKISSDMMNLYKWIINGREKPEFVYLQ